MARCHKNFKGTIQMKKIVYLILMLLVYSNMVAQSEYGNIMLSRAESGELDSQKNVSKYYLEGSHGFPKNANEAFKWISKAAEQGDPESIYVLYKFYSNGIGCQKQNRIDLLLEAANKGYIKACVEAGEFLSQLNGKEDEGLLLLLKAYNKQEYSSIPLIGANYAQAGDFKTANSYFNQGLNLCKDYDLANCYRGLAISYMHGLGTEKNIKKAHEMIDNAIKHFNFSPEFFELKGELFLAEGKIKEASAMWKKVIDTSLVYAQESTSELARAMNHSIDYGIPVSSKQQTMTYAIVIANENYKRVPNVPFAHNDGNIFRKYLISSFGIPEENIEYLEDASLNDIKYAIANVAQRCNAFKDQVSVIVYYAGHGVPDEKTAEAFLLPVDGFGTDPSSGLNLDDFYASLSAMPAKSVVVLLDACFSGAKRDGGMLMATRGITIKPKMQVPDGKLIVLSATSNDETAFPIEQQKHGLFTYTLLRKIQETGGEITWGEIADHVTETVKNRSIDLNGKLQTPTVSVSQSMKDIWKNIKLR